MGTVYLTCLIIGFFFAIISALSAYNLQIDFEEEILFLSPSTIAAFITVFGGTGLFLINYSSLHSALTLFLAITFALFISFLLFFLVILPLYKSRKSNPHSETDFIGQFTEIIPPCTQEKKWADYVLDGFYHLIAPK